MQNMQLKLEILLTEDAVISVNADPNCCSHKQ